MTHGLIEWPPWLKIACQEEEKHIAELRGLEENNAQILKYIASIPGLAHLQMKMKVELADEWMIRGNKRVPKTEIVNSGFTMGEIDETPWCGCFVSSERLSGLVELPRQTRKARKLGLDVTGGIVP